MPAKRTRFFPFGTQILLISHSLFWLATNLISPFMSVFFVNEVPGVTLTEVGIASLVFFLSFGLLEPVVGVISDKIQGLEDELCFVMFGYLLRGVVFILFAFATHVWHLYMLQFFLGALRALAGPGDKVLFTRYLPGKQNATLWGIDESFINISAALGAGLGGYFISQYGFGTVFIVTGVITILAGLINIPLLNKVDRRQNTLKR